MKWTVVLVLCVAVASSDGGPYDIPDIYSTEDSPDGYGDFLKDIAGVETSRRVRRRPVEEIVERTVMDILSGGPIGERDGLKRVTRDSEGNPMLIMGSPYAEQSAHYTEQDPPYVVEYAPREAPCSQESAARANMDAEYPWPNFYPNEEQYYIQESPPQHMAREEKTVQLPSLPVLPSLGSIPLSDGISGGAGLNHGPGITHLGNLGGLGLPGLSSLGALGDLGHGIKKHEGLGGQIGGHDVHDSHVYVTKIPYISGYKMSPIVSEKQVIVKDFPKGHGPGIKGIGGIGGIGGIKGIGGLESSTLIPNPQDFYINDPSARHPLDVNILFQDPRAAARSASEPEVLTPEAYADAICNLQQQMDHLHSLKLAQEQRTQPDESNFV